MNGPLREDKQIGYKIRKYQRALAMIQRENYNCQAKRTAYDNGEEVKRLDILEYAQKIIDLKKRLYELTGRCSPEDPKWPV